MTMCEMSLLLVSCYASVIVVIVISTTMQRVTSHNTRSLFCGDTVYCGTYFNILKISHTVSNLLYDDYNLLYYVEGLMF